MAYLRGWKRGAPDARDYRASDRLLAAAPPPPERASLRDRAGDSVLNQQRNDCVAHALAKAVQIAQTAPGEPLAPLPSRDFLYFAAGIPEGDQLKDDGRYIRDACAALARLGWPDEALWPYGRWPSHPGADAFRASYDRRAGNSIAYYRIADVGGTRIDACKRAIAGGYPFVFGTEITQAFEDQDGTVPVRAPQLSEPLLGGHALCALEYDANGLAGPNSWGSDWGAGGWYRISWDYIASMLTDDLWIVHIVPVQEIS